MKRQRLTTRQRVEMFRRHGGICHLCGGKIHAGERWEVSHPIPLALGGADDDSNRAPAHARTCHAQQTATVDVPAISKAKRREAQHIGARAPSRNPIPGGRNTPWKKTFSFGWTRRNDA